MPYRPSKPPEPIEISQFRGINEAVGETEIALGEATSQLNWRITQNYKPQKRQGHKTWWNFSNTKDVQGVWSGALGSTNVFIAVNDGKVYKRDLSVSTTALTTADLITAGAVTQIGTMTDAKTTIFYFEGSLYFYNGVDPKYYDGTTFGNLEDIAYIPTVEIGSPPAGGGTPFEPINLLTGKKKKIFIADGTSTVFQLPETNIDAATVLMEVNGVTKTEGTHFTVNRTLGQAIFSTAPTDEYEVIPTWTKVEAGNADLVKKNRFALINGPGNDTAIFLWGNPDAKNRRSWSGTLKANYFPVINYTLVGSDEFAITDIKPQYNRQIIFKEDRTHYSYPEWNTTAEAWDYPVYDLNEKVGNVAYNAVQIVRNNPVSLANQSWHEWTSTSVEDERNESVISERLRMSLAELDLTQAVTFDYQKEKEYWCNVGDYVYIWNYGNNTMYIYNNISGTCFLDINGLIYYGSQGTIERMEGLNDNGVAILANLELGFTDFGVNELLKNTRKMWVTIQPETKTSLDVLYTTNKNFLSDVKSINVSFRLLDFDDIDFDNFSFETNRAPQTYRKKIRAKKYSYIKFIFKNDKIDESVTILAIKVTSETTSEVK